LKEINLTQDLEQGIKRLLPPQDKRLKKWKRKNKNKRKEHLRSGPEAE
jgi:hypothetical protein